MSGEARKEEGMPPSKIGTPKRHSHLATAGGVGAILLWSTTIALARSLSESLGPMTGAAAVCGAGSGVALVSFFRSGRSWKPVFRLPLKYLVGCGALFVVYMPALFLAVGRAENHQQALEVGLVNYLWPVLTLVFSIVFLGKTARWGIVPGTLLALAGIFLVLTNGAPVSWHSFSGNLASNPASYSLALTAALSWAMYSNLTRKWAGDRPEGAVVVFLPILAAVLFAISCFLDEPREWSRRTLAEALFLGVATYTAYTLWDNAMRRGNVVMVAAASYLTPFFSTITSCFYLAVVPGATLWAGCAVLALGSFLSWRSISDDLPAGAGDA